MNTPQLKSLAAFIDTMYDEVLTEYSDKTPVCHWAPEKYLGKVAGVYVAAMDLVIKDGTGDAVVVHVESGDGGDLYLASIEDGWEGDDTCL